MSGGWWQLFTAMFAHVDLLHLLSNMLFLLVFGIRGEELFSEKEFFLIYFAGGLSGMRHIPRTNAGAINRGCTNFFLLSFDTERWSKG